MLNDRQIVIITLILCFVSLPLLTVSADDQVAVAKPDSSSAPSSESISAVTCTGNSLTVSGITFIYFRDNDHGLVICQVKQVSGNKLLVKEAWQYGVYIKFKYNPTGNTYTRYLRFTDDIYGFQHVGDPDVGLFYVKQTWWYIEWGNTWYYQATFAVTGGHPWIDFKNYFIWYSQSGQYSTQTESAWWKINYDVYTTSTDWGWWGSGPTVQSYEGTGDSANWNKVRYGDGIDYLQAAHSDVIKVSNPSARWGVFVDHGGTLQYLNGDQTSHNSNADGEYIGGGADLWGSWQTQGNNMATAQEYSAMMMAAVDVP